MRQQIAERERLDFSLRLQKSLRDNYYPPDSPTLLAKEFNLRFDGRSITAHAARKWLIGEAIPTQDKLQILASWLKVNPDWLRFGDVLGVTARPKEAKNSVKISTEELTLLKKFKQLSLGNQKIATNLINDLLEEQKSAKLEAE